MYIAPVVGVMQPNQTLKYVYYRASETHRVMSSQLLLYQLHAAAVLINVTVSLPLLLSSSPQLTTLPTLFRLSANAILDAAAAVAVVTFGRCPVTFLRR